jgi:selenocysteine-specific elongation factor
MRRSRRSSEAWGQGSSACPSEGIAIACDTRRLILGTAGHIDHGKTALIKALTGIDTDRLREEKERGISIDLGFAYLDLPGGLSLGIVDVPGHEKFIKNMLAGVGGIDMVLFVVACDEGIMPQTREHLDIVSLLGVRHGVFALTKTDLADDEMVELVEEEVTDLIKGGPLEGSPLVRTSARTGQGVERVAEELERVAGEVEERRTGEAARLPIDRVFTMTGRGTVVTGTLWSGSVAREDRMEVLPAAKPVRIRSVEVHGSEVDRALAGQRTALGLHGVEKGDLERGFAVVSPGDFAATTMLDAEVFVLPSAPRPVKGGARIRFHLGASEVMARVYPITEAEVRPGGAGLVQMRLEHPVVAAYGDRFVVRSYSPMRTVGGGRVLDPMAPKHRRRDGSVTRRLDILADGNLPGIVEALVRDGEAGTRMQDLRPRLSSGPGEIQQLLDQLAGAGRIFETTPGLYLHAGILEGVESRIEELLAAYQARERLAWGMPREELRERLGSIEMGLFNWIVDRMAADGRVSTRRGMIRAGAGEVVLSPDEEKARTLVIELLSARPFQPPSEREIEQKSNLPPDAVRRVINLLIEDEEITRLEPGLIVHSSAVETAKARIIDYLTEHGEATASDLKNVLGTTRKYAVPLLELLDRIGVTRRHGPTRTLP